MGSGTFAPLVVSSPPSPVVTLQLGLPAPPPLDGGRAVVDVVDVVVGGGGGQFVYALTSVPRSWSSGVRRLVSFAPGVPPAHMVAACDNGTAG